jgi:protein-S-isoprenylcysteine O-methyltransferase Ste14
MRTSRTADPAPVDPLVRVDDHPSVWVFPPLLPLGALLIGYVLEKFFPLTYNPAWLSVSALHVGGAIILAVGLAFVVGSNIAMRRAKTNVSPRQPALRLVQVWPFTWSRNPMYLGGNIGLLGLGIAFQLHWTLLLFPIILAICHYGVVLREEEYLARKFGADYLDYKERVRRWL